MTTVITQEAFERLSFAIAHEESDFIKNTLEELHPEDVSAILYEVDTEGCIYVFNLIDTQLSADILVSLEENTRKEFLSHFSAEQIAEWLNCMDSDDAADLLQSLPTALHEPILQHIDDEHAHHIGDLLTYATGTAGAVMEKELIKANVDWQIRQAIDEIRLQAENVEKIYSLYVVDNTNKLLGRVSLKKIILSSDYTRIRDIYTEEDLITVKTSDKDEYAAEIMQKYDLEALPVVNVRGELVGRITIDDVLDLITDKAELERQLMSGLSEEVEEDDSILHLTRARLPWLIIGMFGGLVGAQFIGLFEADLALLPAMAFFIPLITATGGNVGIQSSSIVLQSLANKANTIQYAENYGSRLFKVMVVAVLNGFVIGAIVFIFSYFIEGNLKLSFVVATALLSVVVLASLMGTITPLVLNRLKINPAVASGPFITTTNDLIGLAVYFTMARWLY
ncbi:MAG: magnesium transporter [Bacteroidetes bacterium]|nr:MAG: magnesium transporter [Bacteroidota bacterium]